ncbi:MAG: NAD-dependent epimerase/dehydratase family protein, partial [Verrucomicrobiales bacterium]
ASSSRGGPEAYQAVFVDGLRHLRGIFPDAHLIFTSSSSVYGQVDGSEVTEESETQPSTETSRLLLAAEKNAHTSARLSGIYGPGRSYLLKKFLAGEALIEDDGRRILNQIHRDDAARALLLLAEKKAAGIYNVSDDEPTSQLKTYQGLAKLLSRPLPPYGDRPAHSKRARTHKKVLNHKLRALGWKARHPSFLSAVPKLLKNQEE